MSRKLLIVLITLLNSSVLFTGCEKDEGEAMLINVTINDIVGQWRFVSGSETINGEKEAINELDETIIFNADGTFEIIFEGITEEKGLFNLTDNTIHLVVVDDEEGMLNERTVANFTDTTLVLTGSFSEAYNGQMYDISFTSKYERVIAE
ncbi:MULTISPECIES: lipocalin family protein [unclassified Carboxylicivirga]|uniref:lipocalin family protein n=1 Tax=Carboxylicivirga TaxID=1628153 RepID=UPI003D34CE89